MYARSRIVLPVRTLMTSSIRQTDKQVANVEPVKKVEVVEDYGKFPGLPKHTPNLIDRLCLVWSGHYKSLADVPRRVEHEQMSNSKNKVRVKVTIIMMVVGFAVCGLMVYQGKQDQKKRRTVEDINLEWHRKINEEHKRKVAEEAAKKE